MNRTLIFSLIISVFQTSKLLGQILELLRNIHPTGGSDPEELIDFDGEPFFRANDLTHGIELWHSHGTTSGMEMAYLQKAIFARLQDQLQRLYL